MSAPLLEARGLAVRFRSPRGGAPIRAVDGVDLELAPGETLGIVGPSGCGKSTLCRALLGLLPRSAGSVRVLGVDPQAARGAALRALRRTAQLLFQDPRASLDPRRRVGEIVAEGLEIHRAGTRSERARRVRELLEAVGLDGELAGRPPHALSGGQRQRVALARALAVEPRLLLCDEPVAALDVAVQAQVVNLLLDLRERRGLAYLFVSHDLELVAAVSHRVAVMHEGALVETGPAAEVLGRPRHPCTRALLAARAGATVRGLPAREPPR